MKPTLTLLAALLLPAPLFLSEAQAAVCADLAQFHQRFTSLREGHPVFMRDARGKVITGEFAGSFEKDGRKMALIKTGPRHYRSVHLSDIDPRSLLTGAEAKAAKAARDARHAAKAAEAAKAAKAAREAEAAKAAKAAEAAKAKNPPLRRIPDATIHLDPPSGATAHGPLTVAERRRAIHDTFGAKAKARTEIDPTINRRVTPDGRRLPFENQMSDRAYAVRHNRILNDVSLTQLSPGQRYTYVITRDGHISFGLVNDPWEFGVKHMHIANGRPVIAAGEIQVAANGNVSFNLLSGTFTKKLIQRDGVDPNALRRNVEHLFSREMGPNRVQFADQDLFHFSSKTPDAAEIARLRASPEFCPANPMFCPGYQLPASH